MVTSLCIDPEYVLLLTLQILRALWRICTDKKALLIFNFEEEDVTDVLRDRTEVAKQTAREVLSYELVKEAKLHEVQVKRVGHLDELLECAFFQLVVEERTHLHQYLVENLLALLLIQKEL